MTRTGWVLCALGALLILGILAGVTLGPANLGPARLLRALVSRGDSLSEIVVWDLRMPRVVAAILVGACLGAAGSMLQLATRNPLGDPQLFGVGGGAAIVQALAMAGIVQLGVWGLMTLSVTASLMGAGVIALFASREALGPARLALIGVSLSALSVAVVTGILVGSRVFSQQTLSFIGGSLSNRGWQDSLAAAPFLVVGLVLALAVAGRLNLLALGEQIAENLGGEPRRTRLGAMASAGFLGGAAVGVGGLIGFVGLLVPHLARTLVGHDARRIILVSIPLGAVVTLYADQVARLAFMPSEVPVGMITTALGAPLMIYVARRVA